MKLNLFERVIGPIAPRYALNRVKSRAALEMFANTRRFDGASKTSRFSGWKRPGTNADSAMAGSISALRNGSRDLTRNNPWASKALKVIANNTVGTGIKGQVVGRNKTQSKKLQEKWKIWTEGGNIDLDNKLDLVALESLIITAVAESGEALIRRAVVKPTGPNVIPFKVQVLEPDFIDTTKNDHLSQGVYIQDGIEFNNRGEVLAYWLYDKHPGEMRTYWFNKIESTRYPADEIIHVFDKTRPGQTRGYPWVSAAIRRLKDYDDYEDAQLVRQKIAAAFVGFVYDSTKESGGDTGLEAGGETDEDKLENFQPGMFEHLGPGKDVKFSSPPTVSNYAEYARSNLMGVAAAYGITYESLTGDYSNVNFSSGRMGWLEMSRNVNKWQASIMRAQFLERLASWFFFGLELAGEDVKGASIKWVYPKREMIDPTKEIPALIKSARAGLTSIPRIHASMGENSDEILEEIAEFNEKMDKLGIISDADPRNTNIQGMQHKDGTAEPEPDNTDEE